MKRIGLLAPLMLLGLGASMLTPVAAVADPAEQPAQRAVAKIDYPGYGIQVHRRSGDERKLKGTPRSFKRFVRARLDVLFADAGSKPRCATSPTVVVSRYHGAGWARAGEGWYEPCPGGGYAVIYEKTSSGWRQILGTQEMRFCQDLAWYGVPRFIAGAKCMTEDFEQVRYRLARTKVSSPQATARRVTSIANGLPIVPEAEVLTPSAAAQLDALIARKAYLAVEECYAAGDADPVAAHLGGAPHGCAVTATYGRKKTESFMLRMSDDLLVTELYRFA